MLEWHKRKNGCQIVFDDNDGELCKSLYLDTLGAEARYALMHLADVAAAAEMHCPVQHAHNAHLTHITFKLATTLTTSIILDKFSTQLKQLASTCT